MHVLSSQLTAGSSQLKLIPYPFHSSNTIQSQLLPDLTDVYIDGSVAYYHIISPNPAQDLIAQEHTARFGCK